MQLKQEIVDSEMEENDYTEKLVGKLWEIFQTLGNSSDIAHKEAFKVTFALFAFKRFSDARIVHIPDNFKWDEIIKHPRDMFFAQLENGFINSLPDVADALNLKEVGDRVSSDTREYLINSFTDIDLAQGKFCKDDVNRIADGFIEKYLTTYTSDILENKSLNRLALDLLDPGADERLYVPQCGLGDIILQAYEYHEDNCSMDYFPGEGMGEHFNAMGSVRDADTRSLAILRILLAEIPAVVDILGNDSILDLSPPAEVINKTVIAEPQTDIEKKMPDTEAARILKSLKEALGRLYDKPHSDIDFFDIVSFYGDVIFCIVPLGYKLPPDVQWRITIKDHTFEVSQRQSELFLLLRLMKRLTKKGRLGIVLPAGALHGTTKTHQMVRKFLIEKDLLEAVIQLPRGLYGHTAHKQMLMIINTSKQESKKGKFAFITVKSNRRDGTSVITYGSIGRARKAYQEFTPLLDNQIVQLEDVRLNNYDLRSFRYVSPTVKEIEKQRKSGVGRPLRQICRFHVKSSSRGLKDVGGIPVVSAKNLSKDIRDLYLKLDDIVYTDSASRNDVIKEKCIIVSYNDNDLMPTIFDPETAKKTKGHTKIVLGDDLLAIFPKKSVVDFDYLYYQLNGNLARVQYDDIRAGWYRRATLGILNHIVDPTLSLLKKMIIPVLGSLEEQRSSAYQQKMELLEVEKSKYEALRERLNIDREKQSSQYEVLGFVAHTVKNNIPIAIETVDSVREFLNERKLLDQIIFEDLSAGDLLVKAEKNLQQINSVVKHVRDLVSREFKREDFERVDIRQLFESDIKPLVTKEFISVKIECGVAAPITIHKDAFVWAISNVLHNAETHGFPEPVDGAEVRFYIHADMSSIIIDYTNNGRPLPKDITTQNFTAFGTKSKGSKGYGLGGAIVSRVIKDVHHGNLDVIHDRNAIHLRMTIPMGD